MSLYGYLTRLENILHSRQDITVETFHLTMTTLGAIVETELRFYDGSQLSIVEEVERLGRWGVNRVAYKFHYQQSNGSLIFRYDDSPHHPHLPTFPSHKHVGDTIAEAEAPDLTDVLREIDELLYPESETEV